MHGVWRLISINANSIKIFTTFTEETMGSEQIKKKYYRRYVDAHAVGDT